MSPQPPPLAVLVPVYNGRESLGRLVASLGRSHPRPRPDVSLLFLDDASPDPAVADLLARDPFFHRPDVRIVRQERNLGFVENVNHGLRLAPPDHDVLLLNADTEVHGDAIRILREVAARRPRCGSLTPLTNAGTIASLFDWPEGSADLRGFHAAELTALVERCALPTPDVPAPTGVGFCLYLPRRALDAVGLLDGASFGRGYGEENDWCQRAQRLGFASLICTETFVYHQGTQSFGGAEKRALLERNLRTLLRLHPRYGEEVFRYLMADPLRAVRARLLFRLCQQRRREAGLGSVLLLAHSDPQTPAGGTEAHVRALTGALLARGRHEVMQLFPSKPGLYRLRMYLPPVGAPAGPTAQASGEIPEGASPPDRPLFDFCFAAQDLPALLAALAQEVDCLHVHNFAGLPREAQALLPRIEVPRRVFTAHDYWPLCPSIKLVGEAGHHCGLPDAASCDRCLARRHGYRAEGIGAYRARMGEALSSFDRVLAPSRAAAALIEQGFPAERGRVEVLENFLPFAARPEAWSEARSEAQPASPASKRLVFLGALGEEKGGRLLLSALRGLRRRGYEVEVWGSLLERRWDPRVPIRGYASADELLGLARAHPPMAVCLPFLWAETFSFATYEALTLLRVPLVVGPYGHPAQLVRERRLGAVMSAPTAAALLDAVDELARGYGEARAQVERAAPELVRAHEPAAYVDRLVSLYAPSIPSAPGSTGLAELPAPVSEIGGGLLRLAADLGPVPYDIAQKLQRLVARHPAAHRLAGRIARALSAAVVRPRTTPPPPSHAGPLRGRP